jgi:succinate dehydrogenase / fumarate reductase iron-sulfur subunit
MNITVRVWRQTDRYAEGKMAIYKVNDVSEHMSFLEMLDVLNERLTLRGDDPIAFDSDCREGICGMCGLVINGVAHGPLQTTTCQLHMRSFKDGDVIDIEPWRADPFPVIKDLVVDRSAFDRIIQAGGYISAPTGTAPDAHAAPVAKSDADHAFDAATCISCGACVAACPNGSAMLFTAAKVTHLALLPQGQPSVTRGCRAWSPSTTRKASAAAPTSASAPRLSEGHPAGHHRPAQSGSAPLTHPRLTGASSARDFRPAERYGKLVCCCPATATPATGECSPRRAHHSE